MQTMMSTDKTFFSTWAHQIATKHPDILEHMKRSTDPLDRAIASRITTVANQG